MSAPQTIAFIESDLLAEETLRAYGRRVRPAEVSVRERISRAFGRRER
jgi:hypothetical protein